MRILTRINADIKKIIEINNYYQRSSALYPRSSAVHRLTRILTRINMDKFNYKFIIIFFLLLLFLPLDKIILFSFEKNLKLINLRSSVLYPRLSVVAHTEDAELNQEIQKGKKLLKNFIEEK